MADVALSVLTTGSLFLVLGVPFAWAIRRRDEGWIALAVDAAVLGTVFLTLAVTLWSWLGVAGVVVSAALLVAAVAWIAVRGPGIPLRPVRPPVALLLLWIVIIAVAVFFRLHDSNFLPWVGDMGAYVNWANEFERTGELRASWPPIYPAFLAISTFFFGTAGTTSGIAWCGFLLLGVTARVLGQLAVNRWIIAAAVGALALNVHAIWYSYFPSSESLNAPVFLLWVSLLISVLRAERRDLPALLALFGLVMLHLGLLRGSGSFLLAPLLVIAVLAVVIPVWRTWARRWWLLFVAALVGAELSIWYGVTVIPRYFVETQVRYLLKGGLFERVKATGIFEPGPLLIGALVLLLAIGVAGVYWAGRMQRREVRGDGGERATTVLAWLAAGGLVVGVALEGIVGANIWFILFRSGIWLVAAAAIGIAAIAYRKKTTESVPVVALLAVTAMVLLAFHTPRLGNNRTHAFFLYWDRYLVSEVLPALFVLAALGAGFVVARIAPRLPEFGAKAKAALVPAVAVVAIAATALPSIPTLQREAEDTYMRGAYEFTERLMTYTEPEDAKFWAATAGRWAPGFFFPNTWMAFAIPMKRSFGYRFLNVDQGEDNFGRDDVVATADLLDAIADAGEVVVYETQTDRGIPLDERLADDPRFTVELIGDETSDIRLLWQRPVLDDWYSARIHVLIWKVTAGAE